MAIKKSELYSKIWASCDELRGGMDASQYKDYVLFMLFIKYVTDKYVDSDDMKPAVNIPPGASFKDMIALKGKSDIGDKINTQIIQPLIDNNSRLARSDFPDFNDPNKLGEGQAMVDRLTNLVSIFESPDLDFSKNRADNDDILGDAYEYLMRHFATQSGKSKGQFYTPSEVSRVISKVIGISSDTAVASTTAYDPTCGSGSLLLKVADEAGVHITLEGQEKDVTTAGLARMNMILHNFPTANVLAGNTLSNPKFKDNERLRTYDYVVANPPFSDKTWSTGLTPDNDKYQRFAWGTPPGKQGDYAYLLHIIRSMKKEGKGACILPHGVLFRGNAEAVIRRKLVESGYLKGIIGLPANLFYGTGIPACIVVLDKENATARKGVFMIDASKGFIKDGNKNRLREQDIHRIVDTFNRQDESDPRYARMVPVTEIQNPKNEYNLNLPRYIDSSEPEDIQDIDGHLRGGIPDRDIDSLGAYWDVIPGVRASLIEPADRPGYCQLRVPVSDVKQTIYEHNEFADFIKSTTKFFTKWKKANHPRLTGFDTGDNPKQLIETISEDLLATFDNAPLLDAYDVYQHLMDYWAETMQDDCYLLAAEGWTSGNVLREIRKVKNSKGKLTWPESHEIEIGKRRFKSDLIPKPLIVARYFAKDKQAIDAMEDELANVASEMEKLKEDHETGKEIGEEGIMKDVSSRPDAQEARTEAIVAIWNEEDPKACGEYTSLIESAEKLSQKLQEIGADGFFSERRNKNGSIGLKKVTDRLKEIDRGEEFDVLTKYVNTDKKQKAIARKAKQMLDAAETEIVKRLSEVPLPEGYEDLAAVNRYLQLLEQKSKIESEKKAAEKALDQLAHDKYPELSVDEIKSLVVDDKWCEHLSTCVGGELDAVSHDLTARVQQLAVRYEKALPELASDLVELQGKVDKHLVAMGASWA
ncbi:Type I restriction enzyme EcoKI M protein [Planctomycetes bacterium CA13]|uniref:site-specific DNA-methyltransferase (adenine-specific) n=1 Tax=Novipirellula herctigrandis TaxID=2527986 RepID=A0A5C5ZC71_9BACT|nr:Type I restriction enzyme EcoKI M protein [Planctomycetes bacterium CA13]